MYTYSNIINLIRCNISKLNKDIVPTQCHDCISHSYRKKIYIFLL